MHLDERILRVFARLNRVGELARLQNLQLSLDQAIALTKIVCDEERIDELVEASPNWGRGT